MLPSRPVSSPRVLTATASRISPLSPTASSALNFGSFKKTKPAGDSSFTTTPESFSQVLTRVPENDSINRCNFCILPLIRTDSLPLYSSTDSLPVSETGSNQGMRRFSPSLMLSASRYARREVASSGGVEKVNESRMVLVPVVSR
ncbi:MAG: hypothetical protein ACD_75C02527G0001 [uncultured bacterium]|nr:MAG: hypothetical protein ACD_75C02527G0001 [uncultured bacterium]